MGSHAIELLAAALLHFLWQGSLLALVLLLARRFAGGPRGRYAAACLTMLLMVACPVVTASYLAQYRDTSELNAASTARTAGTSGEVPHSIEASAITLQETVAASSRRESVLGFLVLGWAVGVLVLAVRLAGGAFRARRLLRVGIEEVPREWQETVSRIARRLAVRRRVRVVVSTLVDSPATLGWASPVVLVPASVFTGLTPMQLEAILAHEIAHIRRLDFLVNLLQLSAETLLFYHPAVWWVSRVMTRERELACDDLAVQVCGDPMLYARALARLERIRFGGPSLAMAASGGDLYERVARLVEPAALEESGSSPRALAVLLVVLLAAIPSAPFLLETSTTQGVIAELPARAVRDMVSDPVAQAALEGALAGRRGCGVVVDLEGLRTVAIVNEDWAARRAWPAASTFKLATAMAAISEGAIDPNERVWTKDANRSINIREAIARSSNDYFSRLGERVGTERLLDYGRRAGFGARAQSDEVDGALPDAGVDSGRLGGLGEDVRITPTQLARVVAGIATGDTAISPEALRTVREGMRDCVTKGTASVAFKSGAPVAGKTASSRDVNGDIGIFAGYGPYASPRFIVVIALDERGAYGAEAAKVAASVFKKLGVD